MISSNESDEVTSFILELLNRRLAECVARVGRTISFYPSKECIDTLVPLDQLVSLVEKLGDEHIVIRIINETSKYMIIAFKYHGDIFVIVPRKNMDQEVIGLIRSLFYRRQSPRAEEQHFNPKIRSAGKC